MSYDREKLEELIIPNPALQIGTSTVLDGTRDKVLVNGPAFSPGFQVDTKAVDFDRLEWLDNTDTTLGFANAWSVNVWWKPTTALWDGDIFSFFPDADPDENIFRLTYNVFNDEYVARISTGTGGFNAKQYNFGTTQVIGVWIMLTATWDGTNFTVYTNGSESTPDKAVDQSVTMIDNARRFSTTRFKSGNKFGAGIMHSAAVWSVELTPAEIISIYNTGGGDNVDLSIDHGSYISSAALEHWYRLGLAADPDIGKDYGNGTLVDLSDGGSDPVADDDIITDSPVGGGLALVTVTLPSVASNNGLEITIKDNAGNAENGTITIETTGGDTVDAAATDSIIVAFAAKSYTSDGVTNWTRTGSNTLGARLSVLAEGATGTMTSEDVLLATSGGITITLPSAVTVGSGVVVYVKDRDGSAGLDPITVDTQSAQTIDGLSTYLIDTDHESITLLSDGTNWIIL